MAVTNRINSRKCFMCWLNDFGVFSQQYPQTCPVT
jgi:hypothetical protein